ncbi:MAG: glutamate-5-semialdehyde dehydrogenase [Opitutales bacterium]|jgi:glutamate-5-semialdehyde dehydrogenase
MTEQTHIDELVITCAKDALAASRVMANVPTARKNVVLLKLAELLEARQDELIDANAQDVEAARVSGLSAAMLDRLTLDPKRIAKMAKGVREVAELPDPVGEELEKIVRPNGLDIRKVRVPIGVIGIIYESRPNVTIDCAALCFKSGNACILRGGRESFHSNMALVRCIGDVLEAEGLPKAAVGFIETTDRYALHRLLKLDQYVHCIIPRGGEGLIRMVTEEAHMPVIKHYKGVCNAYIDSDADRDLAVRIVTNAKVQRPGVCNAIENLVVHEGAVESILPYVARDLARHGVELRCDARSKAALEAFGGFSGLKDAAEEDYYEEFLDLIIAVRVVPDTEAAIAFINKYGSAHSDCIITRDEAAAKAFLDGVDSATVYWNASTRFTDGFEFGMGAEIGISTDKLHARGPMGLKELTTYKYVIYGTGQIRQG